MNTFDIDRERLRYRDDNSYGEMTLTANKRLARRIPEAVTRGNLDVLDDVLAAEFVDHSLFGERIEGAAAAKREMRRIREAFPDFEAAVEDVVAEADLVAMRVTLSGTHDGEFMGIEPTGNAFEVQNMVFTRIEDDRIVERWTQPDTLGMLQQLGVLPEDPSRVATAADD